MPRGGFAEGKKRELEPADVGDVLAQRELAVQLQLIDRDVSAVLLLDAGSALAVAGCIVGLPPVAQISLRVILAPAIVEAMRDLVPDHHADAAVVDRRVDLRIEERRLQDAGGEDDLVAR